MSSIIKIKAPAKINLRLEVLAKRPDGYHELQMIMLAIDLSDEIEISQAENLSVSCNDPNLLTDQSNLVTKAARAFEKLTGQKVKARIRLTKNIPVAAGLGGGSSDAAATLKGLNRFYKTGLNETQLEKLGVTIGADVPFFIKPGHKIARGIGEKLSPFALDSELSLVLINPGFGVSTAEIYQKIQLTSSLIQTNVPSSLKGIMQVVCLLRNDLEPIVASNHSEIDEIKTFLKEAGCAGTMMSGSGPTIFGIFESARQTLEVVKSAKKMGWLAWFASTVNNWD